MDQLQVELRIKAMQPVLIPGPISVDVSGRNDRCEEDLGSVINDCGDKTL
jgi:hypothetical protein